MSDLFDAAHFPCVHRHVNFLVLVSLLGLLRCLHQHLRRTLHCITSSLYRIIVDVTFNFHSKHKKILFYSSAYRITIVVTFNLKLKHIRSPTFNKIDIFYFTYRHSFINTQFQPSFKSSNAKWCYIFPDFFKVNSSFFLLDNTLFHWKNKKMNSSWENEWYAKKVNVLWQKIRHLTSMNDHELLQTTTYNTLK